MATVPTLLNLVHISPQTLEIIADLQEATDSRFAAVIFSDIDLLVCSGILWWYCGEVVGCKNLKYTKHRRKVSCRSTKILPVKRPRTELVLFGRNLMLSMKSNSLDR